MSKLKQTKLQKMGKGQIPLYICFCTDKKEIVLIWEESPDRSKYRTEINGEWIKVSDSNLIRYRFPGQGFWLKDEQKRFVIRKTEEMMKGCKTKESRAKGEYIIEKNYPIKEWFELQGN